MVPNCKASNLWTWYCRWRRQSGNVPSTCLQEQASTCRVAVIPVAPSKANRKEWAHLHGWLMLCVTDTGISWRCPSLLWWASEPILWWLKSEELPLCILLMPALFCVCSLVPQCQALCVYRSLSREQAAVAAPRSWCVWGAPEGHPLHGWRWQSKE